MDFNRQRDFQKEFVTTVSYEEITNSFINPLTENLTRILCQGLKLIEKIDDASFIAGEKGSVGVHFRHSVDFIENFLKGIEREKIDYHQRQRNVEAERNRRKAILRISEAISQLQSLKISNLEKPIMVRIEEVSSLIGKPEWAWSSGLRELDFLQSHTIHHFALIAYKLRALGIEVDKEFGVAPSTLKFWKEAA